MKVETQTDENSTPAVAHPEAPPRLMMGIFIGVAVFGQALAAHSSWSLDSARKAQVRAEKKLSKAESMVSRLRLEARDAQEKLELIGTITGTQVCKLIGDTWSI